MSKHKIYTKPRMKASSVRLPATSFTLVREAAAQQGVSVSEFVRKAIKTEATRALLEQPAAEST
jgi:uncharacterized protein (DUF1778 family)